MRLSWLLSLPAVLSVASALAIEKRDADFLSVRTKMHKDMSGRGGDPKEKYFHESVFHPHYDGRFADHELGYRERKQALSNLIQTYLATMADIGVETWLMHGTLLGWWWNRKILPWDSDSDVQVSESSMHYLASYYNMTIFHYKTPRIPDGRDYMLEINPHYINREQSDKLNVIDARWVDTTSGLFIDITTARYNWTHPAGEGMLSCKDGHEYRDTYIFPLRDTFFEGTPAKIPFAYKEVLEAEYHQKALTLTDFENHHFDQDKLEWIPVAKKLEEQKPVPRKEEPAKVAPQAQVLRMQQQQVAPAQDAQKPANDQISKPAGASTEKPPVSKQPKEATNEGSAQTPKSEPAPPLKQKQAEHKINAAFAKQLASMNQSEEQRRVKEQKAIKDEEDREKKALADEGAKKLQEKEENKATSPAATS
ncbi:LicD family-domain-containing protein [Halenospora varia]|nr:LicD family-domain-containing protein [Halenospora varia]